MVKFWDVQLERAIKLSKSRRDHHEKHGCGTNAMEDKNTLKKQERKKELRKQ